jgi:hypothetical protein
MPQYRLIEIKDKLINNGDRFWKLEKRNWFGIWSEYNISEHGATFYNYDDAVKNFESYAYPEKRITKKVIAQK